MDQAALKETAVVLQNMLKKYSASDKEAALFASGIESTLQKALSGEITSPIRRGSIPGVRFFEESSLREYKDLEDAVAKFNIQLTGGYTSSVLAALESIRNTKPSEHN